MSGPPIGKGAASVYWPALVLMAAIVFQLHPLLRDQFRIGDDHELVRAMGAKHYLTLRQVVEWIYGNCANEIGRFRPLDHVWRAVELYCLGNRPPLYHALRIVLACLSALALYGAGTPWVIPWVAAMIALSCFVSSLNHTWQDLATAEAFGFPWVALAVWLASRTLRRQVNHDSFRFAEYRRPLFLLAFSGFFKESFVPLAPAALIALRAPLFFRGAPVWNREDWQLAAKIASLTAGQALGVLSSLILKGHHYGEPFLSAAAPRNFIALLETLFISSDGALLPLVALAAASLDGRDELRRITLGFTWVIGLVFLPQFLIVENAPFMMGRYAVPGVLVVWMLQLIAACYLLRPSINCANRGPQRLARSSSNQMDSLTNGKRARHLIWIGLLAAQGLFLGRRVSQGPQFGMAIARESARFHEALQEIIALHHAHPERVIILYSAEPYLHYETLPAVRDYLLAEKDVGPVEIRLAAGSLRDRPAPGLARALHDRYHSPASLQDSRPPAPGCLEVDFSRAPPFGCTERVDITSLMAHYQ